MERFSIPDEESEIYHLDSLYTALTSGTFESTVNDSGFKRPPLSRTCSNPVFQSENSTFTLPNAGSNVISSSFLPSMMSFTATPSVHQVSNEEYSENRNTERSPFPFKKSKTAPKLGSIISSGTISPVESPTLKIFGRKNLGHPISLSPLRDRNFVDPSNFLASEVAESVLDTPSNGSTPLGRKFFQQETPSLPKREFSGSAIQPIDVSESELSSRNPPVSNQCESDDATTKNQNMTSFLDFEDNFQTGYINSILTQTPQE